MTFTHAADTTRRRWSWPSTGGFYVKVTMTMTCTWMAQASRRRWSWLVHKQIILQSSHVAYYHSRLWISGDEHDYHHRQFTIEAPNQWWWGFMNCLWWTWRSSVWTTLTSYYSFSFSMRCSYPGPLIIYFYLFSMWGCILIAWRGLVCRTTATKVDNFSTSVQFVSEDGVEWWFAGIYGP